MELLADFYFGCFLISGKKSKIFDVALCVLCIRVLHGDLQVIYGDFQLIFTTLHCSWYVGE